MQHEIEFTANEWYVAYTAVGNGHGRNVEEYMHRVDLLRLLELSDAEREAINWRTVPLPDGGEAPAFDGEAVITRALTSRQRRLCLQSVQEQIALFRPGAHDIVLPTLKKLGWERGDAEEEG